MNSSAEKDIGTKRKNIDQELEKLYKRLRNVITEKATLRVEEISENDSFTKILSKIKQRIRRMELMEKEFFLERKIKLKEKLRKELKKTELKFFHPISSIIRFQAFRCLFHQLNRRH